MSMGGIERTVHIRIGGGGSRGVLELNIDGEGWGAVCDDAFIDSTDAATAFCQQMGYISEASTFANWSSALLVAPQGQTLANCWKNTSRPISVWITSRT